MDVGFVNGAVSDGIVEFVSLRTNTVSAVFAEIGFRIGCLIPTNIKSHRYVPSNGDTSFFYDNWSRQFRTSTVLRRSCGDLCNFVQDRRCWQPFYPVL